MPTYKDLFEVHLKYPDYVRAKSLVIHQFVHNINVTGSGVEVEARALLRSVLPGRFRVTHGYIVSCASRHDEPSVSPQTDVIVVDTLVPHTLWLVDETQGIEIVPQESVVAVAEVKRTLTKASIADAVGHLRDIQTRGGLRKDDDRSFLPGGLVVGGGLQAPYRGNPLIAILGLATDAEVEPNLALAVQEAVDDLAADGHGHLLVDCALSLSGNFIGTGGEGGSFSPKLVRDEVLPFVTSSVAAGQSPRQALAKGLGFIVTYVSHTCGRAPNTDAYFFNDAIA